MRRRFVSEEDRDTVIKLRKSGAGWLKIQEMTGIPRRTAKSVYEQWQKGQTAEEVTTARRQVAAEAFNFHMSDLMALAYRISSDLAMPQFADRRDGSQVMENIFRLDIRGHSQDKPRYSLIKKSMEDIKRQNRILFDSLKEHTKEKIDWRTLDDWVFARNEWKKDMDKLETVALKMVNKTLDREADEKGLSSTIKSDKNLVAKMARSVAETVYRIRTAGEPKQPDYYIKVREGKNSVQVFFSDSASETELAIVSRDSAVIVAGTCIWAVTKLTRGKESTILRGLDSSFCKMETAHRELTEKLDELRLTPLILRTECEICPA